MRAGRGRRSGAAPTLVQALQRGTTLTQAALEEVRSLLATNDLAGATSLAESLRAAEETGALGELASGVVAAHGGHLELAWERLGHLPAASWSAFAAAEYARAGLMVSPDATLAAVRAMATDPPASVTTRTWLELLKAVYGYRDEALARQLLDRLEEAAGDLPRVGRGLRGHMDRLGPWVRASGSSPTAPASPVPSFAVIDYGHPNINAASSNIGDHVQTVASLGHLVRHVGVRLRGDAELVGLLEQLRSRTRPERQHDDLRNEVEVMTVHRDVSMYDTVPEGTWVLCFGWFMSPLFSLTYGFPLHPALRPVFISFHCNRRAMLTDEAVDYLRRYGPVGCRDWTTVYLLLSMDVPAFFSGCVTTTVDALFPDLDVAPSAQAPRAYVDVRAADVPPGAPTYAHLDPQVLTRSFAENVQDAVNRLETYRREHSAVTTSRLHCYLPVRSLGVDVEFTPSNRSDVRFDGLIDISDDEFDRIRSGIEPKLERVFRLILGGRGESEVYQEWRALTAADVEEARRRWRSPLSLPPPRPQARGRISAVTAGAVSRPATDVRHQGPAVHCVVHLRRGQGRALEVLAWSLAERASRPVHLWVLTEQLSPKLQESIASRVPSMEVTWLPVRRLGGAWSAPGQDGRGDATDLLLSELLPSVDRAVVMPVEALVTADVAELSDLDLGGCLLAAPTRTGAAESSGFDVLNHAALRLKDRIELSASLRRSAYARHAFDFDAFSTDVMAVDLQRMRGGGFVDEALALMQQFDMDAVELLHYVVGPNRVVIPPRWWHVPTRHRYVGPGLTHWADPVKPWSSRFTPGQEQWHEAARSSESLSSR